MVEQSELVLHDTHPFDVQYFPVPAVMQVASVRQGTQTPRFGEPAVVSQIEWELVVTQGAVEQGATQAPPGYERVSQTAGAVHWLVELQPHVCVARLQMGAFPPQSAFVAQWHWLSVPHLSFALGQSAAVEHQPHVSPEHPGVL